MEGRRGLERRIPTRLTAREGRRFGVTLGIAFAVFGGIFFWRDRVLPAEIFWAIGAILVGMAILVPTALTPVERFWMGFARIISRITTPIFMGIVYFGVVTPTGLIMRALGRDPLKRSESEGGFFVRRDAGSSTRGGMKHQF